MQDREETSDAAETANAAAVAAVSGREHAVTDREASVELAAVDAERRCTAAEKTLVGSGVG